MKLVTLELQQWRSFASCALEFPDGLIGVRGPNGAGKSTIAEAIGWALFGKLRGGAKVGDLKRQDAPRGTTSLVRLRFRLADTEYRVERVVGGHAKLWIGDGDEPETTQTRATNDRIALELDLNWETFGRTVFARQKDVAALDPSATGEARKRHVERLLGLERYRLAADTARVRTRELEQQLIGLREQAPDLDALRAELADAEAAATEGDPAVRVARNAEETARSRVQEIDTALNVERERTGQHDRLSQAASLLSDAIDEDEEDLANRRQRLAERRDAESRLAALNGQGLNVREREAVRRQWDALEQCHADVVRREREVPRGFDQEAAEERDAELRDVRTALETLGDAGDIDVATPDARVAALARAAASIDVATAERELTRLDDERDELTGHVAALKASIASAEEHVAAVEQGAAEMTCPTCLRPFDGDTASVLDEHRRRIDGSRDELERLASRFRRLDEQRAVARGRQDEARGAADAVASTQGASDLAAARAELDAAQRARDERAQQLAQLRGRRTELEPVVTADEQARQAFRDATVVLDEARARLAAAAIALDVPRFDPAAHASAVEAYTQELAAAEQRQRLLALVDATKTLEADVELLEGRLTQRRERRDDLGKQVSSMQFDPGRLPTLTNDLSVAQARREQALQVLRDAELLAQHRDQRVGDLRRAVGEGESAHTLVRERELEAREHKAAGDLLNDYRSAQHQRAWPKLETGASALLNDVTDGRYADVRLSDDYKIVINDRGESHGLERFSGGEQDLANLCLRLAIAQWVSRERGVEMGFVVLDEVFGSQDEERRQRLLGTLRALSERFHQLLLITHVPEIAELCEHQLVVELLEPGSSRATITS